MFARASECAPPEQLRDRRWGRLQDLVRETLGVNPFWTAKWRAAGLTRADDLRGWDDFERLPLTTKREFVDDQAAHAPFGTNLTYPLDCYVRVHQTSGTKGQPLRWLDTPESWQAMLECWNKILRLAGVTAADRLLFPFSFGPFLGFWTAFEAATRLGALCLPAGRLGQTE